MKPIEKLALLIKERGLDAMLIGMESRLNRRYLNGFRSSGGVLIVSATGEAWFIIDGRYHETADDFSKKAGFSVIRIMLTTEYDSALCEFIKTHGFKRLGYEAHLVTAAREKQLMKMLPCELVPSGPLVEKLRACKTREEAETLIVAQRMTEKALFNSLDFIKPGRTEREIATKITIELYKAGAEALSFNTFCLTGANAARPHGVPGDRPVKDGDLVLIDMGAVHGGFYADMSRTFAIGHADEETERIYYSVLDAQLAGIAAAAPGKDSGEVEKAARDLLRERGLEQYFTHLYGHGVGLAQAELPFTSDGGLLEVGNIFSAEPGVYIEGRMGIRIEDLIWLSEDGTVDITEFPKELTVL